MSGSIHYEIFSRKGKAGGWSLHAAVPTRDAALAEAKTLVPSGAAAGVRVFKETFKADTGEFQTLKIFEDGDVAEKKAAKSGTEGSSLPCFKADDFYSFHGKRAIARVLRDALSRWRITVTELMHHAGHVERLELTGTVLQGAVQKAAIKHAGATGDPVQQVVKQLNELVSRAMERVIMDGRKNRFPSIAEEGFGPLCIRLSGTAGGDYYANAAIAYHIESSKTWGEKLDRVLKLMTALPPEDGPGRTFGLKLIDSLVGEMLTGNAALGDLLGEQPDLGTSLLKMADLFLGKIDADSDDLPSVKALCREFEKGNLVNSRAAIAQRVLQEIEGVRRLKPDSIDDEVKVMRLLATRMVMGQGKLVTQEEILDAFVARSKQLVTPTVVDAYLAGLTRPEDRVEKLLTLEENVIGSANKRNLVGFVSALLTGTRTEAYFVDSAEPPQVRFALLARLSQRLQKSGFQELNKRQLLEQVDALAQKIDKKTNFVETVLKTAKTPFERAEKALALICDGLLPEGRLIDGLKTRLRETVREPGFKYAAADASPDRRTAFGNQLAKAGLDTPPPKDANAA